MKRGRKEGQAIKGYPADGYVYLNDFIPVSVGRGFVAKLIGDLQRQGIQLETLRKEQPLLRQAAVELYSYHYSPMALFHWGMTPAVSSIIGEAVLPTYAYFRIYRAGDTCRVHGDRPACEHSVSLTLASSDEAPWPLEFASTPIEIPYARADNEFRRDERRRSVDMASGDAVLYRGVEYHHGRTTPNPNAWSAHLFLHWVTENGPHAENAFDGQQPPVEIRI